MPWWGWIVVGALLLGAEAGIVDAEFYLVFLGISALLVGLVGMSGVEISTPAQFLLFAFLAGFSMFALRRRLYGMIRAEVAEPGDGIVGSTVQPAAAIEPGANGRVELRGSNWTARNTSDRRIDAGARAVVRGVEGLVLHLAPADEGDEKGD